MVKSSLASNPLRKYRKAANMSMGDLANEVKISEKTIYLAEHGVYDRPLEQVAHYFARTRNIDLDDLNQDYADFRAKMRQSLKERIDISIWHFSVPATQVCSFRTPLGTKLAPIKDFRVNCIMFTQTEFEKEFLVNPGMLTRLEIGKEFATVPRPIREALIECGAPGYFIKDLDARTKLFHASCRVHR